VRQDDIRRDGFHLLAKAAVIDAHGCSVRSVRGTADRVHGDDHPEAAIDGAEDSRQHANIRSIASANMRCMS
jgi:hypothetical protein